MITKIPVLRTLKYWSKGISRRNLRGCRFAKRVHVFIPSHNRRPPCPNPISRNYLYACRSRNRKIGGSSLYILSTVRCRPGVKLFAVHRRGMSWRCCFTNPPRYLPQAVRPTIMHYSSPSGSFPRLVYFISIARSLQSHLSASIEFRLGF